MAQTFMFTIHDKQSGIRQFEIRQVNVDGTRSFSVWDMDNDKSLYRLDVAHEALAETEIDEPGALNILNAEYVENDFKRLVNAGFLKLP